jgi:hypothetical protein
VIKGVYGFAHVCDGCGAVGPVVGKFLEMRDIAETNLECDGGDLCKAKHEGWQVGERDLCPECIRRDFPVLLAREGR